MVRALKRVVLCGWCILLLYMGWLLVRAFFVDYFTVPSSSMTPTIKPGSIVVVNKLVFGPRLYTKLNFSSIGNELKAVRLKGVRDIKHNDIVVFNYPIHGDKISFVINNVYCKRVTGLPGDTLSARKGHLHNNNFQGTLGSKKKQEQLAGKSRKVLEKYEVYDIAPHDGHFAWNIQDWGPLYVPRKGDVIRVTPCEAVLYHKILEWETGTAITWNWETQKVFSDGNEMLCHRFTHNYYHVCGDYSLDSFDSRYWGFVPEEYIVGVVTMVIPRMKAA